MQKSEACLGHCQTFVIELLCKNVNGQKLLTIFAKNSVIDTVIDRVLNTPLTVYFHSLFILGVILNLEFHTFETLLVSTSVFRTLSDVYNGVFLRNLNKSEQIGPKIL